MFKALGSSLNKLTAVALGAEDAPSIAIVDISTGPGVGLAHGGRTDADSPDGVDCSSSGTVDNGNSPLLVYYAAQYGVAERNNDKLLRANHSVVELLGALAVRCEAEVHSWNRLNRALGVVPALSQSVLDIRQQVKALSTEAAEMELQLTALHQAKIRQAFAAERAGVSHCTSSYATLKADQLERMKAAAAAHSTGVRAPPVPQLPADLLGQLELLQKIGGPPPSCAGGGDGGGRQQPGPTEHGGFACDGCGVGPIVGVRYSRPTSNRDLCTPCWVALATFAKAGYCPCGVGQQKTAEAASENVV